MWIKHPYLKIAVFVPDAPKAAEHKQEPAKEPAKSDNKKKK